MSVLVVIVNYRTGKLTTDALRSLASEARARGDVTAVVVDGNSGDDSVATLAEAIAREGWQSWVELRPLDVNGGFAYGNNAGIEPALKSGLAPDWVLLLNPDTVLRPGAVTFLVDFMAAHPRVGIAGSRLENPDGTPQYSAFRFHHPFAEFEAAVRCRPASWLLRRWLLNPPIADQPHRTQWVTGASMMVRRQVFDQIGLLDPAYFLYYEETDFCLRAARAGWECWYVPDSRVVHLVGQASGVTGTRAALRRRPPYWFASRRRYYRKNHGLTMALLADICFLCGYGLWNLRRLLTGRAAIDPPCLARDLVRWSLFGGSL